MDRVLSYIVDLRRSPSLSFIPLEPYPARSARHLPHAGKALSVDIVFSTYAYIRSDDMGIAVLSYNGAHETIFPLFFIPLSLSNLRPFGAPPSIGRRECPREPLPLEGAAERSEAGLASFLRRSGALANGVLETISPALFHPARTLSGSLRSPPSPRGEGC